MLPNNRRLEQEPRLPRVPGPPQRPGKPPPLCPLLTEPAHLPPLGGHAQRTQPPSHAPERLRLRRSCPEEDGDGEQREDRLPPHKRSVSYRRRGENFRHVILSR
ncbi:unnamed protein product [Darwinula stevensoni]|uniref:Uncharacterized protein n=1 Tax=Darwinula stevensoni TaxID=69355 RepID=A0A7R9AJT6_9CRUS|nr:unnamed protein product [Darwinula stevensoni]CAG0910088.1 unnamed protein product [Darwinula stevensoni]